MVTYLINLHKNIHMDVFWLLYLNGNAFCNWQFNVQLVMHYAKCQCYLHFSLNNFYYKLN